MSWCLYPVLLWTDVPDCCFAESLDHRDVQRVTPLPWQGPTSFISGVSNQETGFQRQSPGSAVPRGAGRAADCSSLHWASGLQERGDPPAR